ncbi:MAG: hypothetical protein V2I51_14970 [Anderseniella sp.]|nr:hypothetical protein [Anderseniella sp.]
MADDNEAGAIPAGVQWAGERVVGVQGGGPRQGGSACRDERLQ